MHPSNETRRPATPPGSGTSAPRSVQRGASFVATVGDWDAFRRLRRLLILEARRGAARRTSRQNSVSKLTFTTRQLMSLMVAVPLSSLSLTVDRSSIRFPLLSLFLLPPFSRICCWTGVINYSTSPLLAQFALGVFFPRLPLSLYVLE